MGALSDPRSPSVNPPKCRGLCSGVPPRHSPSQAAVWGETVAPRADAERWKSPPSRLCEHPGRLGLSSPSSAMGAQAPPPPGGPCKDAGGTGSWRGGGSEERQAVGLPQPGRVSVGSGSKGDAGSRGARGGRGPRRAARRPHTRPPRSPGPRAGPLAGPPLPAPPSRPPASRAQAALPRAARHSGTGARSHSRQPASRGHGLRRPRVRAAPPQPATHAHLLERLLQLRPVHRLPGAHAAGPALPDAQLAAPDLLGLLLAAALPPAGQRPRGRLQEDVSARPARSPAAPQPCCPPPAPLLGTAAPTLPFPAFPFLPFLSFPFPPSPPLPAAASLPPWGRGCPAPQPPGGRRPPLPAPAAAPRLS